jgi:DnaJ-class molecular chaperone
MDPAKHYKDYYYILGVPPDATSSEIREAYQNLYDKYGPHVSIGSQDPEMLLRTFKDISEAFELLMDPQRRKEYDENSKLLHKKSDLRSLWKDRIQAAVESKGQAKEENRGLSLAPEIDIVVEVSLKEAIKGTKRGVEVKEPKPCAECQGLRPINRMQCPNCRGLGYSTIERTEEIELPAGLYDKMQLRYNGLGKYDLQTGRRGDLLVNVALTPHPILSVLERDVTCTIPVTFYEAVLGAEIDIPTITGKVVMKIQPLTQSGRVYRLKGMGLAGADQLVTIEVLVPKQLTNEQMDLVRKMKSLSNEPNPRESLYNKT